MRLLALLAMVVVIMAADAPVPNPAELVVDNAPLVVTIGGKQPASMGDWPAVAL